MGRHFLVNLYAIMYLGCLMKDQLHNLCSMKPKMSKDLVHGLTYLCYFSGDHLLEALL